MPDLKCLSHSYLNDLSISMQFSYFGGFKVVWFMSIFQFSMLCGIRFHLIDTQLFEDMDGADSQKLYIYFTTFQIFITDILSHQWEDKMAAGCYPTS